MLDHLRAKPFSGDLKLSVFRGGASLSLGSLGMAIVSYKRNCRTGCGQCQSCQKAARWRQAEYTIGPDTHFYKVSELLDWYFSTV